MKLVSMKWVNKLKLMHHVDYKCFFLLLYSIIIIIIIIQLWKLH